MAAVFIAGEPVVDLWGGHFDATDPRHWEQDTIGHGFSSTRTMTRRGELDLNAPAY